MTISRLPATRSARLLASFISLAACAAACDAPDGSADSESDGEDDSSAGDDSDGGGDGDDGAGVPTTRDVQGSSEVTPRAAAEHEYAACDPDSATILTAHPDPADGGHPGFDIGANPHIAIALPPVDNTPDYTALVAGAAKVTAGQPSPLILTSPSAFPLMIDEAKTLFAAAARVGAGKVVVFGHDAYVNAGDKVTDNNKMLANAVAWVAGKPAPVIGVAPSLGAVKTLMTSLGYTVQTVTPSQLAGVSVYINTTFTVYTEAEYENIRQFMSGGGGVVLGGQAWSYVIPANGTILDYPGNRMLRSAGIVITKEFFNAGTDVVTAAPPSPLYNAAVAVDKLLDQANKLVNLSYADQELAGAAVERAAAALPLSVKEFYDKAAMFAAVVAPPTMQPNYQFYPANNPSKRAAVRVQARLALEQPVAEIKAHPLAADFPGAIDKAIPRETVTLTIDGDYAGRDTRYVSSEPSFPVWRSTGLYATAGEFVKIKIPPALASAGLTAQIGVHTDTLWSKTGWSRFPQIVRTYPLDAAEVTIASAFGGLVYIRVPGGKQLGPVDVTIENVGRAPLYVHGETTLGEWLTIRNYPGPWAELASDKMIIMVPSANIKNLADPVAVMNLWDQVMDAEADLGAISHDRVRPERYLVDRDIGAGTQHSGYPIMALLSDGPTFVSTAKITAGLWGSWHEIGHNHQWGGWRLDGTTESSVNLFSVYVSEVLLNIPRAVGHGALKPADRATRTQSYRAKGKPYANWGSDAWLPLEMYLQLQEGFGWAPYITVFGQIQALSPAATPTNDAARIPAFTTRFSQAVGKNLGPFFKDGWGMPVPQTALDTMAALPIWNDACASAVVPGVLGQSQGPLALANDTDVDWFFFDAAADAVGKKVRVVTAPGDAQTDTVVEVFSGECQVQTTLGGPSDDINAHENWLSTPIAAAGRIYVKVSYSNSGYVDDMYKLTVTFE